MYSDRSRGGRSGFGGGGGGGGGGGYGRRDGGYGDQGYQQRSGGGGGWDRGSGGGGPSHEILVEQKFVGRIIGKGGSKIRELQDQSGAQIKVNSREVEDGQVRIVLNGSEESCCHAEGLIKEITTFSGYGSGGGGGGGGGGRYGGRRDDFGSDGGRRTCYKCGGEGHFARDCTSADSYQQGGGGGRRPQTCYRCGEEGHMARDCSGGY